MNEPSQRPDPKGEGQAQRLWEQFWEQSLLRLLESTGEATAPRPAAISDAVRGMIVLAGTILDGSRFLGPVPPPGVTVPGEMGLELAIRLLLGHSVCAASTEFC